MNKDLKTKRLLYECKFWANKQKSESFYDENIFVKFYELSKAYVMLVGPKDTPYEKGFFFFNFDFSSVNFPINPPKVKYLTQGHKARFNPNLYTDGTVCLSLLGTWGKNTWLPVHTIETICQSILGLVMIENPIICEPGYTCKDEQYIEFVRFRVSQVAIMEAIDNKLPITGEENKEFFKNIIQNIFKKNKDDYVKYIEKQLETRNNKYYKSSYQNSECKTDYKPIYNFLLEK